MDFSSSDCYHQINHLLICLRHLISCETAVLLKGSLNIRKGFGNIASCIPYLYIKLGILCDINLIEKDHSSSSVKMNMTVTLN